MIKIHIACQTNILRCDENLQQRLDKITSKLIKVLTDINRLPLSLSRHHDIEFLGVRRDGKIYWKSHLSHIHTSVNKLFFHPTIHLFPPV